MIKEIIAPIIQAKDCKNIKLGFQIVEAEKIKPINME